MKRFTHLRFSFIMLVALLLSTSIFSQIPQKISYQAIIRNTLNQIVPNKSVGLRFSLATDTIGAAPVYVETNQATTSAVGLLNVQIGAGTPTSGTFNSIDWNQTYFLKMEVDITGGTNYTLSGYNPMLSVPYALTAKTALSVANLGDSIAAEISRSTAFNGDYNSLINKPSIQDSIQTYGFSGDYPDLTNKPNIRDSVTMYSSAGDYNNLLNKPSFPDSVQTYGFSGSYPDLTNKPSIPDSITTYLTTIGVNYVDINNAPVIRDSITYFINNTGINYPDLLNKPSFQDSIQTYGFSGDYPDLTNKPNIRDSVTMYSSSGDYNSLLNKPSFPDSIQTYGFSGDYPDLTNKPSIPDSITTYLTTIGVNYTDINNAPIIRDSITYFINNTGINYPDLLNKPSFPDSIQTYGFSGDYPDLTNKPSFPDSISNYLSTTGISYLNLTDKPSFPDSIQTYGFSGDYPDLTNKPSFPDSISNYLSTTGISYASLTGKPSFPDSISNYLSTTGISYINLTDKPSFSDSIQTYGFSGNYPDLTNKPNIKDSVLTYSGSASIVKTNGSVTFKAPVGTPLRITPNSTNRAYPLDVSSFTQNLTNAPLLLNGTQQASFLGTNYTSPGGTLTYDGGSTSLSTGVGSKFLENSIKGQMHSYRVKIGWSKTNNTDATFAIILYNPSSGFVYRVAFTPQDDNNVNGATIFLGGITADSASIGLGYVMLLQIVHSGTVNWVDVYEVKMISDFTPSADPDV